METKKNFDCLKMKQIIQQQIYAETKNMTSKELLQYFNGSNIGKRAAKPSRNDTKLNPCMGAPIVLAQ